MQPLLKTVPFLVLTTVAVARIRVGELSTSLASSNVGAGLRAPSNSALEPEAALPWPEVRDAEAGRAGGLAFLFLPCAKAGLDAR